MKTLNSMSKKTAAFEYMPMLNPWEKLAEAVLIWKAVGRVCTPEECLTLSIYYLGGSKSPTLSILIIDTTKSGQQWPRAAVIAITMIVTLLATAFVAISAAYKKAK